MIKWFTEHPATIGETYFSHLFKATAFGVRMLIAGIACIDTASLVMLGRGELAAIAAIACIATLLLQRRVLGS